MKFKDLKQGGQYNVSGTLINTYGSEHMPSEMQSVVLRLADGQALNTNINNLIPVDPDEYKEMRDRASEEAAAAVAASKMVVDGDAKDELTQIRRERDEWRQKAEQLEAHAKKLVQDLEAAKQAAGAPQGGTKPESAPATPARPGRARKAE